MQSQTYFIQSDLEYYHYKSLEEALFVLLYGIPPKNYELSAYKNQIKRFIVTDLQTETDYLQNQMSNQNPIDELRTMFLAISTDNKMTSTYAVTRMTLTTARLINLNHKQTTKHPEPSLNLLENFLMMIGMDHTQKNVANVLTQYMIRCIKQELFHVTSQSYAMNTTEMIDEIFKKRNLSIYDPQFIKLFATTPVRVKWMEWISLLARVSGRLIIS